MDMKEWAKHEVEVACKKRKNASNSEWAEYDCSCYESALKAYNSLSDDGHSGCSWNLTKNILIRLMNDQPLTPITEEDFKDAVPRLPKGDIQCPRMSSLFKRIDKEGNITYSDIDRVYCVNINNEKCTYFGGWEFVDKMFPITLPYTPINGKYKVYMEQFLTDKKNGDYDTTGYMYMITPDNERIEINKFKAEIGGESQEITKEEYEERKKNKIN